MTITELHEKAMDLYFKDRTIQTWIESFKLKDLACLWYLKCVMTENNMFGVCYDDEIYNALNRLKFFDQ